ncbi:MAG: hypothetical protein ACYDHW_16380 [Syntrophorhabdaceae bacterium]
MNFPGAVLGGLVATFIVWVITRLSTMNLMGLERYFSTLFNQRQNTIIGFVLLYALGIGLGLVYAALWSVGIGWPSYLYGLIFGVVQWLVIGLLIGFLPAVHAGIRSGSIRVPGIYMTNLLGMWAVLAGLVNNVIFGLAFAYIYQFFASRYDWVT